MPDERPTKIDADFSEEEIARRRDDVSRRLLSTTHKPQSSASKSKAKKKAKKAPAKA